MTKVTTKATRVFELAKQYNISSNAMLSILQELDLKPKSHMSAATDAMKEAVAKKFTEQKQAAKKEMEHREQTQKAVEKRHTNIGGIKVSDAGSPVAGIVRRLAKKQKKKERRKKPLRNVDKKDVARSFKTTMATLTGTPSKKRYKRSGAGESDADLADANLISVNEFMSVAELSAVMNQKPAELIAKLLEMGLMATINQRLDMDTIEMIADEFGFAVRQVAEIGEASREEEDTEALTTRPPIVTVMGHVDHGKTSLLDHIRSSNVVEGEAGAITQHIGAYEVEYDGRKITFLDTPGHEAFTAMRARGTQVTDIVILVVAADDGVQPQTIEAIDHAKAANVPIIVAVNKIDKPNSNPDSIRTQLSNHNLLSEEWGGKVIMVDLSAKTGEGVDKLLEMILLQSEIMDLTADATIRGQGVVIDSFLEKGRGPVVTVLIQRGTSAIGDSIVVGTFHGRIRSILGDRETKMTEIGPSTPAQITGLNGVPQAGDSFMSVANDQIAKEIAIKRSQVRREQDTRQTHGSISLKQVFDKIKEGQIKELRLIIKADVDGSVGVLSDTLAKIQSDEVRPRIIHRGVGAITESDVLLATASKAIIIGFHVTPDSRARDLAKRDNVEIRLYNIIYEVEKEVRDSLSGMLAPSIEEKYMGSAEVRDLFKVPKAGVIAGSYVRDGRINRTDKIRLVREGTVIFEGSLASLRRFKDDAREVKEGFECGIGLANFNDLKIGDIIESLVIVEIARTL